MSLIHQLDGMKERIGKTKGDALKKMRVLIETGNIAQENAGVLESLHKPGNEECIPGF